MARGGSSGGRSGGGSFGGSRSGGGRSGGSFGGGSSFGSGMFGGGNRSSGGGIFGGNRSSGGGSIFGGGSRRSSGGGLSGGGGFNPFPGGGMFGRNTGGGLGGGFNDQGYDPPLGGGNPGGGGPFGGGTGRRPGGCGCGTLITVIVIFIVVMMIFSMWGMFGGGMFGGGYSGGFGSSNDGDITKSSVAREPLPSGSVNETAYYTDELNVIQDRGTLLDGMKHFYKETGVQPYLVITGPPGGFGSAPSMEEMDAMAEELYEELFTDEAHLLFIYYEYENSYINYYLAGTQAKSVIDEEAGDILLDYMDRYYYDDSLTYDEFFAKSFSEAADRIMIVTRSPWIPVMIVLGVFLLAALLFVWWLRAKKQKNLEAQQTEDILNVPLDKFGTTEAEELAKKYGNKNPDESYSPEERYNPKD